MRTYLRSDYALHPCGAGYEYCDGECSHCEAAASTYISNTAQPKYEPWRKEMQERPVTQTNNEQTGNNEVAFGTAGRTY